MMCSGEGGAQILVSVSPEQQVIWESYLKQDHRNDWQNWLGGGTDYTFTGFTADNQPLIEVGSNR